MNLPDHVSENQNGMTRDKNNFQKLITAPFNKTLTLKFKIQPTNAFFSTVNQVSSGSS